MDDKVLKEVQIKDIARVLNRMYGGIKYQDNENIVYLKEVKKGYIGRKKYIVTTLKDKYFIKVLFYSMSKEEIEKTKWLYKTYIENNIPLVPLLDIIVDKEKTYMIYPFLDGVNLGEKKLSLEEYFNYGIKIANEVKKMNQIRNYPSEFNSFDIKHHYEEYEIRLNELLMKSNYKDKIMNLFTKDEVEYLMNLMKLNFLKIVNNDTLLNHNDIKLSNIILDEKNNYFLVDIDYSGLTLIGYNLNYSIFCFLFSNVFASDEKAFLKGFIKGIDPQKKLINEWEYFIITDFINELKSLIDKHYNLLASEIEKVKKVLFNEDNNLEKVLYEDNLL